jgi:aspartyl-tRNA(Asn)/glutamyl-tRNA(Gln) amidotransferase subunit A
MAELTDLGVRALRDGIRAGTFSAVEVADAFVTRVSQAKALNAFIVETPDHAIAAARDADRARAAGETLKPLAGVPIGMKDLFCTKGVQSTAASHILEGFEPEYESTVSQKLWDAGAGMLGKLNMDQFAMGSSNETSYFGNVISPWRRQDGGNAALAPGGSSGGSSAAIAARLCPAATGTDTGGSIRQPAAFTGISGIKPTYGRCSRWGVIAFASSLDQAGPMARDVRDCAIMLEAMSGFDAKDSTSLQLDVPKWEAGLNASLAGKRIGIPREYRVDGMPSEIEALWQQGIDWVKDAGAELVEVSLPHTRYALPAYYIIAPAEASSNNSTLIARDFDAAWQKCDLLLTPTAPSAAFALGEKSADPIAMYLNDVFTVPSSLAGLPAMSVPGGLDKAGLPLGLQIIGKALDEQGVLDAGLAIEERAGFRARPDAWW